MNKKAISEDSNMQGGVMIVIEYKKCENYFTTS